MKEKTGVVVQILYDEYILMTDDKKSATINATIKKTIRNSTDKVYVGDVVDYELSYDKWVITKIHQRKNSIIRPPVANIDQMVLLLSVKNPDPDYLLLDKELVFCFANNIKPIICVNKIDLDDAGKEVEYINKVYKSMNIDIVYISIKENMNIEQLETLLIGKNTAFSGNSGVGKSSLTNHLLKRYENEYNAQIGELSSKLNKGKHTTKTVKLYVLDGNTYILDTPGFSSYELYSGVVDYKNLKEYYPDYLKYQCKYADCRHVNESVSECQIKTQVKANILDINRYERYVFLYDKLKEQDMKKYK